MSAFDNENMRFAFDAYMEEFDSAREHIVSYDMFVDEGMKNVIDQKDGIVVPMASKKGGQDVCTGWLYVVIQNPRVAKPTFPENGAPMYPMDARRHVITYAGDILADVMVTEVLLKASVRKAFVKSDVSPKIKYFKSVFFSGSEIHNILSIRTRVLYAQVLGRMPVMLRSKSCRLHGATEQEMIRRDECPMDSGGYFITRGQEKIIVSSDRLVRNKVKVLLNKDLKCLRAEILSSQRVGGYITMTCMIVQPGTNRLMVMLPCNRKKSAGSASEESAGIPLYLLLSMLGIGDYSMISRVLRDSVGVPEGGGAKGARTRSKLEEILECNRGCMPTSASAASALLSKYIEGHRRSQMEAYANTPVSAFSDQVGGERTLAHERAESIYLDRELLPHLGSGNLARKGVFLCAYMARDLLCVHLGLEQPTDRDSFCNKRIDSPGYLLETLFKDIVSRPYLRDLHKTIYKAKSVSQGIRDSKVLTKSLQRSISTGDWSAQKYGGAGKSRKTEVVELAVSQQLSRMSHIATMAYKTKVETPSSKNGAATKIRALHPSHMGVFAPEDTPEGKALGIVKGKSVGSRVSLHIDSQHVIRLMLLVLRGIRGVRILGEEAEYRLREDPGLVHALTRGARVAVNGIPIAACDMSLLAVVHSQVRKMRNKALRSASVVWCARSRRLDILSDEGRLMQPLIPLSADGVPALDPRAHTELTMKQLQMQNKIVFVSCVEEEQHVVATTMEDVEKYPLVQYTMVMVHPSLMLGVASCLTPFPERNPAPRNTYQSAMAKQAMGVYALNYRQLGANNTYVISYPQKALVSTRHARHLGTHEKLPNGINVGVDIMSWTGYNMEDAIIINKSAVDRGLFMAFSYKKYVAQENKGADNHDKRIYRVCKPNPKETGKLRRHYAHLDEDGIVPVGTRVSNEMVLVGMVSYNNSGVEDVARDCSVSLGMWEEGVVDTVTVSVRNTMKVVQVVVRRLRTPEIGDKFTFPCAQKSVNGQLVSQEDMPFDPNTGATADIVFNCCSLPSRMTVSLVLQCVLGMSGSMQGRFYDATAFEWRGDKNAPRMQQAEDALRRMGLTANKSRCRNPYTGELIDSLSFRGVAYYNRLPHLVSNKQHARSRGLCQALTRQPREGRARDGGLRAGEMERDSMIGSGGAFVLRDRMVDCSDKVEIYTCRGCGAMSHKSATGCRVCKTSSGKPGKTDTCYAAVQLAHELEGMGVGMNWHTR